MYRVYGEAPAWGRICSSKCSSRLSAFSGLSSRTSTQTRRREFATVRSGAPPPPPPLPPPPGGALRGRTGPVLPPPPPLCSARLGPASGAGTTHAPGTALRSPQDVLSAFIRYIPTYYVSVPCVASVLPEELREQFVGRGRLLFFLKRFPFLFDLQLTSARNSLVRLRSDVSHPQRGEADDKYMMTDVGEVTSYIAKPEYIESTESLDNVQRSVLVKPTVPPPSVKVQLEERVPVVDRLRSLVPTHFVPIEELEETVPEDVLFHPYFDCQGGLLSIAGKLPEELQVVEGRVRRRPRHLAPLALGEYTLENSPFPEVAAMVRREVCASEIPHWVNITSLYEQLTREQKYEVKQRFKSFAGFLRAHGRALAVSTDMLQVSMWICVNPPPLNPELEGGDAPGTQQLSLRSSAPPSITPSPLLPSSSSLPDDSHRGLGGASSSSSASLGVKPVTYSREEILNAWYDRFPPHKTLNLRDAMALLPLEMRTSGLPTKIAPWLATHPHYFTVDYMEEEDPTKVLVRRASERQPLDLAAALYAHMPEANVECDAAAVLQAVEPSVRRIIEELGVEQLADMLPQWLRVSKRRGASGGTRTSAESYTIYRLQESAVLAKEIQSREAKKQKQRKSASVTEAVDAEDMENLPL